MERSGHGSAGDDGSLHRFPDPPPPANARDTNASHGNAALVRRRDELLWELHNEHIRLDMILRELVETEYAIAARVAPAEQWFMPMVPWSQDRWHRRASPATTWVDTTLRHPSTYLEHPACSRNPAAVRPPVHPHDEKSPSPIAMSGYLEYCQSLSKQTLTKGALKLEMDNASVRPMGSVDVRQEVTPEHKDAVGGQHKADFKEGAGKQPLFERRNQSSGQWKASETTMVDWLNGPGGPTGQENAAFMQQKRLEFNEFAPEQPWSGSDAKQQQEECRSSGATVHGTSSHLKLFQSPSKQTRVEDTLVPGAYNAIIRQTRSASGAVAPGDEGGQPKVDVENGHVIPPLYEIGKQISGQRKTADFAMEAQNDRPVQSPRGCMPAGPGKAAYHEQKEIELCEPTLERTPSGLKRRLTEATPPVKKPKSFGEWSCIICQVSPISQRSLEEALHARNDPAELNTKAAPGQWNKNLIKDGESLRRGDKENVTENIGSWRQLSVKNRLEPAPSRWICSLCQAKCTSESNYNEHLRGRRHRENTGALCAESRSDSESSDGDAGRSADWKRAYYCDVCDLQCNSEKMLASHLGGRRHREALE